VTALIVGTSDDRSVADAMLYRIGDAEISADAKEACNTFPAGIRRIGYAIDLVFVTE